MGLSLAAGAFAALDEPERAATMLGASGRVLDELGYADLHPRVAAAARAAARAALSEEDFSRAFARGAAMTDAELEDWLAPGDDDWSDRPVAGWDELPRRGSPSRPRSPRG